MGVWLSIIPSTVNGMELGLHEWKYSLLLPYGIDPPEHFSSAIPLTARREASTWCVMTSSVMGVPTL